MKKLFAATGVTELHAREENRARLARTMARDSTLGWIFDAKPRLQRMAEPLLKRSATAEHLYRIDHGEDRLSFRVIAVTNRLYPPKPGNAEDRVPVQEEPASLVFSCHPNGSVVVLIYPHASDWGKFGRDSGYIIALYNSSNALAGSVGDARIRRHIALFLKVSTASLAASLPTRASGKLLEKLETASNRYSQLYQSKDEKRRAMVESELALGAGLAAGLIASTVFPIIQKIGENAARDAADVLARCGRPEVNHAMCMDSSDYDFKLLTARAFAPEILLIAAAVIVTVTVFIMLRRLKST